MQLHTTYVFTFFFLVVSSPSFSICITVAAMSTKVLNRVTPGDVSMEIKDPVDPTALQQAKAIMDELLSGEESAGKVSQPKLLDVAKRLGDVPQDATTVVVSKEQCKAAFEGLSDQERTALTNIYGRVKTFAEMQRTSVVDMEMDIPGGTAGHTVSPCKGE
jgi:histidinol dehydrogenase